VSLLTSIPSVSQPYIIKQPRSQQEVALKCMKQLSLRRVECPFAETPLNVIYATTIPG
jgi:hypothetical protein